MPINQYDNPVRYEYKSLGLSKLAGPLAAAQQKFDLTQATLDDAEFNIDHLPWGTDPERAKALIAQFEEKRDKIADDLMGTKNFRKATQQLKSLNRAWGKNPESKVLTSNYLAAKNREAEARKRFLSGNISQEAYEGYRKKGQQDYEALGGASFSLGEDGRETYNVFNRQIAIKDMSKEYDDMKIELAKMSKADVRETLINGGIDHTTHSKIFIEQMVEELTEGKVTAGTEAALKSMTRFKPWIKQRVELDYLQSYNPSTADGKANGDALINSVITEIESGIAKLEELDQTDPDKKYLESKVYSILKDNKDDYEKALTDEEGTYLNTVKGLHKIQFEENLNSASALGKLMAYKKVTKNWTFKSIPQPKGPPAGGGRLTRQDILSELTGMVSDAYEPLDIKSLRKQRYDAARKLKPGLETLTGIGDGVIGEISYRKRDLTTGIRIKKNIGVKYASVQKIITLGYSSNTVKQYHTAMWKAGYQPTWEQSKRAFNALTPEKMSEATDILRDNAMSYNQYNIASTQEKSISAQLRKSKPYLKKAYELGARVPKDNLLTRNQHGRDKGEAIHLFHWGNYTEAELIKAGVKKPKKVVTAPGYRAHYTLSYNDVAKLNGYKSMDDAVGKGFRFGGLEGVDSAASELSALRQELVNKMTDKEVMTWVYVNDPDLEKGLGQIIKNTNTTEYIPAGKKDWKNFPGFDDKGKPNPGTVFTDKASFTTHGGTIVYRANYEYIDPETQKVVTNRVGIQPKDSDGPLNQTLLDLIDISTAGNSAYKQESRQLIHALKFDIRHGNFLNDALFEAIEVPLLQRASRGMFSDEGYRPPLLDEVPIPGELGTTLQFVKVLSSLGKDKIVLQTVNLSGTIKKHKNNAGQVVKFDNVRGAKAAAAAILGYVIE